MTNKNPSNKDPISGAPGAHPAGVGAGAAAGAVTGAALFRQADKVKFPAFAGNGHQISSSLRKAVASHRCDAAESVGMDVSFGG